MYKSKKIEQTRQAQKIARRIERACDSGDLLDYFFSQAHISTYGNDNKLGTAYAVFGDCPWTELKFDASKCLAYVYVGRQGLAKVPSRAIPELKEIFSTIHNS